MRRAKVRRGYGFVWIAAAIVLAVSGVRTAPVGAQGSADLVPGGPAIPTELVHVRAAAEPVAAGQVTTLRVHATVLDGWHVNANPPSEEYLVATAVELELPGEVTQGQASYPGGRRIALGFSEEPLSVYEGSFVVEVPLMAAADAEPGARPISGRLRYQACNDELCLAPASVSFTVALEITPPTGEPAVALTMPGAAAGDGKTFTSADQAGNEATRDAGAARMEALGKEFADNPLFAFVLVFGMGLALNLTPCVYPMLSVTLALFGARTEKSAVKRLPAAVFYVLGIAAMYSVLGLVAAFTGTLFGSVLQNQWVLIGIAVLLGAMAISMFGAFELQAPSFLLERLGGQGTAGLFGVFFSGLVVGVFAAPCIGPPIVALLAVVAQSGNPVFGFWVFFILSLGLGLPYLLLATYTGLLQKLPRSGEWMVWVKKLFGVLLLGVALFYFLLAVRDEWAFWVVPVTLVVGGLFLGFVEKTGSGSTAFAAFKRTLGLVAAAAGVLLGLSLPSQGILWEDYTVEALGLASADRQPVILEFSASWCIPCKELEHVTFTDGEVMQVARKFRTLKVDLTDFDAPASERIRERFQVGGVPTIVFLGADGNEVPETRVVGFVPPQEFVQLAQRALASGGVDMIRPAGGR